jgi:hypothetical protein
MKQGARQSGVHCRPAIADFGLPRFARNHMSRISDLSRAGNPQSGTVLIVTIWVVLVLAGLALVFAQSVRVAATVSANHVASLQTEAIAAGAME